MQNTYGRYMKKHIWPIYAEIRMAYVWRNTDWPVSESDDTKRSLRIEKRREEREEGKSERELGKLQPEAESIYRERD